MEISAIVCTRNRSKAIEGSLASIVAALEQVQPVEAELLVVNNGSTDDTAAIVRAFAARSSIPVRLVDEPAKGLSRARNKGIAASSGRLIFFTDDDCRMEPDYFVAALARDRADGDELIFRSGMVLLGDPTDLRVSYRDIKELGRWNARSHPKAMGMLDTVIIGANLMMRRELADRIGPFDTAFGAGARFPGGEEFDYLYRVYAAGLTIEYAPDMVIHHFHGRKLKEEGRKLIQGYTIGSGALYAKHSLRDARWLRPLYWHVRDSVRELVGGTRVSSEYDISHFDVVKGAIDYYFWAVRSTVPGARS
ncbi:MAG: glycosyltransferase family 2 protein [Hyphomicrobiales bacterium]|nr:MAG: glycosyltransferase family 2 protein [Hyphomicrobiales bacterium]